MKKKIDLETILSVTSGISCVDDFNKVFNLAHFVFDDEYISSISLLSLFPEFKKHLLSIYPELEGVKPDGRRGVTDSWINEQKDKFGNQLTVCQVKDREKVKIKK